VKTLTSPPRLRLHSGMQIFVKHRHAFGLQHPKGVISTLLIICVGDNPLLLHLVLCLCSGMQIFVKHQHTFGLQHPKGVTTFVLHLRWGRSLLHLVLLLCSGMQIFVKHQHPFGHTFGLQHPKGVTTLFFVCVGDNALLLPYFSTSFFICVAECRFSCQAPACMAISLPYCTCHCMPVKYLICNTNYQIKKSVELTHALSGQWHLLTHLLFQSIICKSTCTFNCFYAPKDQEPKAYRLKCWRGCDYQEGTKREASSLRR